MERLYQEGEVYLNSATEYNKTMHNQAVRDDELAIDFKGGYVRATHPTQFYDIDNPPPGSIIDRGVGFRAMYDLPELGRRACATMTVKMETDYWMFCAATFLTNGFSQTSKRTVA